ncbi:MAG: UDP-3-O-(3-hydroxymyristoyl)glucosamine N-acyltransferase [Phycisphaerales bacterium]|nr:UDP-3-O-(3-hydroxymyristoyl)glucosamine N-acyltransferase [Phycisphaerales bacterium]
MPASNPSPLIQDKLRFTVSELAQRLNGRLQGRGDTIITGVNSLADASDSQITFISTPAYARQWLESKAAAALVTESVPFDGAEGQRDPRPIIFVKDSEMAMIRLLQLFDHAESLPDVGVHPSAVVHPSAKIGRQARIGPHVSIDQGSSIGDEAVLYAGVRIYANVSIGHKSVLHSNVVIRDRCPIGRDVIIHQNVSIGADGFGYRPDPSGSGLLKIPHIGNVVIEDAVEIGANTCVDRGKFGSTIIGAGTKIDNQCQIAHNCRIGRCCVIAGCAGIAGSVIIEDGVQVGAAAGILEHLTIGAGARLGAMCLVTRDVPPGHTVLGHPAGESQSVLRQWASVRKLPDFLRRLSRHS